MTRKFNITIVSPSDVKIERLLTKEVCQELNSHLKNHNIKIVPHLWEDYPADYHLDRQKCFNIYHNISESNLVVGILWTRIGTILTEEYKGNLTGKDRVTGTQYELENAISLKKRLWIYLKKDKKLIDIDLADSEILEQNKRLKQYLKELKIGFGNAKYGYHYFYEKDFKSMFQTHLIAEIQKEFGIEIELDDTPPEKLVTSGKIDPGYYAGLYGFLVIGAVILLFYTMNFVKSPKIQLFSNIFVWSLIFVNLSAVKSLPTYSIQNSMGFREVSIALIRRAAAILFFAMLLTVVFYLVAISLGILR